MRNTGGNVMDNERIVNKCMGLEQALKFEAAAREVGINLPRMQALKMSFVDGRWELAIDGGRIIAEIVGDMSVVRKE